MGKRSADDAAAPSHKPKRSRTGIRAALPTSDDAWRRKLQRAKESKVIRAKTLQTYHKVKAQALAGEENPKSETGDERVPGAAGQGSEDSAATDEQAAMHPERQARIDGDDEDQSGENENDNSADRERRPRARRPKSAPSFFQKAREEAAQKKAATEQRLADLERRRSEREEAIAQRRRHQKAVAKARRVDTHGGRRGATGGDNQRRKLGRESGVLLYQVRKMMGK
ncbi:hypothetical protein SEPCBS119000_002218 [Sporothrix epigloea]|uniref:rRNA-processing protein FYV7 n=1 Tax=Sporothrix epigloea TaxID=1892477 RepID=A0ABP0DEY1_9PEZI